MFGALKKHLKNSIKKLTKRVEEKEDAVQEEIEKIKEEPKIETPAEKLQEKPEIVKIEKIPKPPVEVPVKHEEKIARPEPLKEEKPKGRIARIKEKVTVKKLSDNDIDDFFAETEVDLLQANVAMEVIYFLKSSMKEKLSDKPVKRAKAGEFVLQAFEESLFALVNQGTISIEKMIKKKRPLSMVFLGFNGSGKTTTIAKIANYLQGKGHKTILAAGDTFRAASIEQLEHHGNKLGIKTIKHKYGADSAAVIFDAIKHAESKGLDIVLADTAGRSHTDKNLMDELEKVCRVNKPDLKVLVVDSLTGNDAVEQAKRFNETVGVDAVILTKTDVNEKGGSILSVCYAIKKPVLFLGTGQGYSDLEKFEPKRFVHELLE